LQESIDEGRQEAAADASSYDDLDQTTSGGVEAAEMAQEEAQEEFGIGHSDEDHEAVDEAVDEELDDDTFVQSPEQNQMDEEEIGYSEAEVDAADEAVAAAQDEVGTDEDSEIVEDMQGTEGEFDVGGGESDEAVEAAENVEGANPSPLSEHINPDAEEAGFSGAHEAGRGSMSTETSQPMTDPITMAEEDDPAPVKNGVSPTESVGEDNTGQDPVAIPERHDSPDYDGNDMSQREIVNQGMENHLEHEIGRK
jgi:hypothetical protein